ncbi:MAG: hypothetical protein ACKO3N_09330, partial [Verrucomicrobiota bacterium]
RRPAPPVPGRAAAPAGDHPLGRDLEQARDLLLRQAEVSEALAGLNALVLGSSVWRTVDLQASGGEYTGLLRAVRVALEPAGPQGEAISTEERAALLGLPRPPGIGTGDVAALVDRFASLGPQGLALPPTALNRSVFDRAADLLDAVYAAGWRSPHDGAMQALILLGRWFEPLPPGSLLTTTGGDPGPEVFPSGRHHYLLVNLETGFAVRGRTTPQGVIQNQILAPNTRYSVSYYLPASAGGTGWPDREARHGHAFFNSQAAGVPTRIPYAPLRPDGTRDLDADGLSDVAEMILGTSVTRADSDADGTRDAEELAVGTDPLDGVGLPVGIVSVTAAPGTAYDVAAGNDLAVVAASQGLAVYEVSRPTSPVQLAVVPGAASAVALQGSRALAGGSEGVRLIDLAEPAR